MRRGIKYNRSMILTKDQVKHVAKLANLPLSFEEEDKYTQQISKILDYIEQLNTVNTTDIEPTFNVSGHNNILREDNPQTGLSQQEALANASKKKDNYFETKGIFNE